MKLGRTLLLTLSALSTSFSTVAAGDAAVRLTPQTSIHFASAREGAERLGREDPFIKSLSQFDCQARLRTEEDVSARDVAEFAASQVVRWQADERAGLRAAAAVVSQRLQPFELPFPPNIFLVKTTGKEEGGAAYCRGNTIVFPEKVVGRRPAALQRLMIHELFHVLSSHNPALRSKLYAIIGFTTCPPLPLPPSLRDRKLTNPDAPRLDAYIELRIQNKTPGKRSSAGRSSTQERVLSGGLDIDGRPVTVTPVLFATPGTYDVERGGEFFDYLTFRLMAIEAADNGWRPALRDGQPQLFNPRETPSYHAQIGKNTGYIIHPDEILADNFVHLVNQTRDLESPEIIDAMRQRLIK